MILLARKCVCVCVCACERSKFTLFLATSRHFVHLGILLFLIFHSIDIMAFRNLFTCFVCDGRFQARQMRRIDGNDYAVKRDIAIFRRDMAGRLALEVTDLTRLCVNCNCYILDEIDLLERDPTCMRINVLSQTRSASCLICNTEHGVQRLSLQARVNIFITSDIYIPSNVRSCQNHLDGKGFLLRPLHTGLRFINRPYVIRGQELQMFIKELWKNVLTSSQYEDEEDFDEEDFKVMTSLTKAQFRDSYFAIQDPNKGLIHTSKRKIF